MTLPAAAAGAPAVISIDNQYVAMAAAISAARVQAAASSRCPSTGQTDGWTDT